MLTLLAGLLSVIFALIALVAHFFGKSQTADALLKNNGVKDQLNALDGQISKNQGLIDAEKQNVKDKEANETNDSILNDLNRPK